MVCLTAKFCVGIVTRARSRVFVWEYLWCGHDKSISPMLKRKKRRPGQWNSTMYHYTMEWLPDYPDHRDHRVDEEKISRRVTALGQRDSLREMIQDKRGY